MYECIKSHVVRSLVCQLDDSLKQLVGSDIIDRPEVDMETTAIYCIWCENECRHYVTHTAPNTPISFIICDEPYFLVKTLTSNAVVQTLFEYPRAEYNLSSTGRVDEGALTRPAPETSVWLLP